jgi:hypothetical protein
MNKERILLALFCCVLAAVPFLVVKFPPLTDLPQHVAQVRLFADALSNPASPYRIQWITPYSLVYSVLGASWLVFGPLSAGRMGMLVIAALWIIMLYLLAAQRKRPVLAACLASILFFGHILYWGFYQFALGWPLFIGWVLLTQRQTQNRWKEALLFLLASVALYMAHVFWFLLAIGWLVLRHFVFKGDLKKLILRLAAAAPLLLLGIAWYPSLAAYGFQSQTIWLTTPLERLLPSWIVDASFGGLRGSMEPVFFTVLVGWILIACLQNRKSLLARMDKELFLLGALLLFLALILPDKQTNTIRFCQRWVPPAFAFLLLSLPELRVRKSILTVVVIAIVAGFFALTSLHWIAFESSEMSGLQESLEALPEAPRVLGLSYVQESAIVRGRPFIQVFAYCQVLRGGELNFSFADFGPSLVVYRQRRRIPWTPALEWLPQKARRSDFQYFDYSLINADEKLHAALHSEASLKPITQEGRWRLYEVTSSKRK